MNRFVIAAFIVVLLIAGGMGAWMLLGRSDATIRPAGSVVTGVSADLAALPVVYATSFDAGTDQAWSHRRMNRTPTNVPFLGQFSNETARLRINDLPHHDFIRITLDLYIVNTWDGSGRRTHTGGVVGPDFWTLAIEDGPTLIRTTFSTTPADPGFAGECMFQAYPSPLPAEPIPMGTASTTINGLGYIHDFGGGHTFPMDATYKIDLLFPHQADSVQFNFTARNLQDIDDESWGIGAARVEALTAEQITRPTPQELAEAWTELLDGPDAIRRAQAFWRLVSGGDAAVEMIDREVQTLNLERPQVNAWIDRAIAERPTRWDELFGRLVDVGPALEPIMMRHPRIAGMPEAQREELLQEVELAPLETPLQRRHGAAARLLMVINTYAAGALLDQLLDAAPRPLSATEQAAERDAGWLRRLQQVYRLHQGWALVYVRPPHLPERDRYRAERGGSQPPSLQPGDHWVFWLPRDSEVLKDSPMSVIPAMRSAPGDVAAGAGLKAILAELRLDDANAAAGGYPRVIVPPQLEEIELAGDWVVNRRAPPELLLSDLVTILTEQLGRSVSINLRKSDQEVVVVRGELALQRSLLPDGAVAIFTEPELPTQPIGNRYAGSLQTLLRRVGTSTRLTFIDETASSTAGLKWGLASSILARSGGGAAPLPLEQRDQLLANLAAQTSLSFTVENRPVENYVVEMP